MHSICCVSVPKTLRSDPLITNNSMLINLSLMGLRHVHFVIRNLVAVNKIKFENMLQKKINGIEYFSKILIQQEQEFLKVLQA